MLNRILGLLALFLVVGDSLYAEPGLPVDRVIELYVQALGGMAVLDRISSRQLEVKIHGQQSMTYLWQAPNRVLKTQGAMREGFDGSTGWLETKKKKVQKLPHSVQDAMETDANPIRYAHLRNMFTDLSPAPRESVDGTLMDVVIAPNHIGNTKLFFDSSTHLLRRVEEFGLESAYFKHVTEFSEYKDFDGVKIPTRIDRESEEPGAEKGTARLSKIKQNVQINAIIFTRPNVASAVLGGKR